LIWTFGRAPAAAFDNNLTSGAPLDAPRLMDLPAAATVARAAAQ